MQPSPPMQSAWPHAAPGIRPSILPDYSASCVPLLPRPRTCVPQSQKYARNSIFCPLIQQCPINAPDCLNIVQVENDRQGTPILQATVRGRAKITSHFLAGPFGRWHRCSLLTDPLAGYARRSRLASGRNPCAKKYEFILAQSLIFAQPRWRIAIPRA